MLTNDRLKECLYYSPLTGLFIWLISPSRSVKVGDVAGTDCHGYISINVDGVKYSAHRLAWFYMTGRWPVEIDHRDLDKSNTKWANLREVSHSVNMKNGPIRSNNISGVKGVSYQQRDSKWSAKIYHKGKSIYLGMFNNFNDAVIARRAAELIYG